MNLTKLKQAEDYFLSKYPGGFSHPDMVALGKKHNVTKMVEISQEVFSEGSFGLPGVVLENMVKVIGRSSMVSMFEKPKFRSFASSLSPMEQELLVDGLQERLHGNEQQGFEMMLDIMKTGKLAKWSLISICPVYFRPDYEVFVKPTTVKNIIQTIELEGLQYKPTPSWEFYQVFRDQINEMKAKVDPSLSPSSPAFTGFLMMSLKS